MKHRIETELKMLLNADQVQQLLNTYYKDIPFIYQLNTYYKSNNSNHYTFRIREREGISLFTLKEKVNGETMEYEKVVKDNIYGDKELMELLAGFNEYPPFKILGQLGTLRADYVTDEAVISLDINFYNHKKDFEIEYEVKKPHDHLEAFNYFLGKAGIDFVPNRKSKYKRFLKSIEE